MRTPGSTPHEVIALANRHPRVKILAPGIGVGGHCIPVDPWFLKEIAPYNSRLITTARLVNDDMPSRIAAKIRHSLSDCHSRRLPAIVAFGATYKKDCEDIRESPALEIVQLLERDGYDVTHVDPLVPAMAYDDMGALLDGLRPGGRPGRAPGDDGRAPRARGRPPRDTLPLLRRMSQQHRTPSL